MSIQFRTFVGLPPGEPGSFDHGDVYRPTGEVLVAHTSAGTVEVIDGERLVPSATVPGCPQGSGVLCAQEDALVFAAARGAGRVLVIEPRSWSVLRELPAGTRPNGLAWDPWRGRLLVADVEDHRARIVDPRDAREVATTALPGRPRWCLYQREADRYLINIAEPALLVELRGADGCLLNATPVSAAGPHGLDVDPVTQRAFVACDAGKLVVISLRDRAEIHQLEIAGPPDVVWFNPERRRLYVAIGDPGLVQVIDVTRLRVVEEVMSEAGAHTTAFDRRRQRLYAFLPRRCALAVYEEA